MSFVEHTHLEPKKSYKLIGKYHEYAINVNPIDNETYLGELYQILLGPPCGGDRDVYYCFKDSNENKYRLEEYYIEKYGVKFELINL
jgi:hypothetical protein